MKHSVLTFFSHSHKNEQLVGLLSPKEIQTKLVESEHRRFDEYGSLRGLQAQCSQESTNYDESSKMDATKLVRNILNRKEDANGGETPRRTVESFFSSMEIPIRDTITRSVCKTAAQYFTKVAYFPVQSDPLTLMTTDEAFAHTCLLHSVVDKLSKNGIDSFLWWGSLLGAYRHHGPIPWHLDNDIFVHDIHMDKMLEVLRKWRHDEFGDFLWMWHDGRERVNLKIWYSHASRIKPTTKYRYPFLDIWFYKIENDKLSPNYAVDKEDMPAMGTQTVLSSRVVSAKLWSYHTPKNKYDDMNAVYNVSDFLPLVDSYFAGAKVGTPRMTEKLLREKFDNIDTLCMLGGWNHRKEEWVPSRQFDCCVVYGQLPFVDRSFIHNAEHDIIQIETLKAHQNAIHHLYKNKEGLQTSAAIWMWAPVRVISYHILSLRLIYRHKQHTDCDIKQANHPVEISQLRSASMAMTAEQLWCELEACMAGCLSIDEGQRHKAEARMTQLETMEDYAIVLVRGCTHSSLNPQTRQMACMVLKKFIIEHWSKDDDTFKGPECSPEIKALVRAELPNGLADADKSVRTAVAYTISKIATHDWPDLWPGLMPNVLALLNSGVTGSGITSACDGAVRVLEELVNDFDTAYLLQMVESLLPSLFVLASEPVTENQSTHARVINIFSLIFDLAGATEQANIVTPAIEQLAPLLAQYITPAQAQVVSYSYTLRRAAVSCVGRLAVQHPKTSKSVILNTLLPAVCSAMPDASAQYVAMVVLGDGDEPAGNVEEGDNEGCAPFVCSLIDVLTNTVYQPVYRKFLKQNQENMLYIVLGCMQMTNEQIEIWNDDVNQFLADDSEESMSLSVRNQCIGLISALAETTPTSSIAALFTCANARLQESHAARTGSAGANDSVWWRMAEASLLALGCVGAIIQDEKLEKAMSAIDISSVVQSVFAESLTQNNAPYLIGRTLWFAGQYAFALNEAAHALVVTHCATALDQSFPMPVRILALRAAKSVCEDKNRSTEILKTALLPALYAYLPMLLPVATDDLLLLVLELLALAIPLDPTLAGKYEAKLCPLVVAVWIKFANDPMLCAYVSEVYLSLSQTPCLQNLIQRSLPPIVSVLNHAEGEVAPGMQASAVDFLTTNVRACSTPLPDVLVSTALPALIRFLGRTEDEEAIQNGCECLVVYLSHGHEQLVSANLIEPIVSFVAAVLNMSSDSAGTLVGRLILKLIKKVDLGEYMVPMLNAALHKLGNVNFILYEQTLVVMFAQMLMTDMSWTLNFLTTHTVDVRTLNTPYLSPVACKYKGDAVIRNVSGFELVLVKWVEGQQMFNGRFDVNTTLVALCQLCQTDEPLAQQLLQSTVVKGERVVSKEEMATIRTRSRGKKITETFTAVSLADKIVTVLSRELLHRVYENESTGDEDYEDSGEDDGWVDEPNPSSEFASLSDALYSGEMMDDMDDDSVEDPEVLKDPLFSMDMKEHISKFLKAIAHANPQQLMQSLQGNLQPSEIDTLQKQLQQ
eukprot:CFRG7294T1